MGGPGSRRPAELPAPPAILPPRTHRAAPRPRRGASIGRSVPPCTVGSRRYRGSELRRSPVPRRGSTPPGPPRRGGAGARGAQRGRGRAPSPSVAGGTVQPRRLRPTALLRRGAGGKGERGGRDPAPGDPPARPCAAGGGDSAGAHGGGGGGGALWAGGAPASRGRPRPRASPAGRGNGRGNRPEREGELVRLRLPSHRPHILPRGASARPPRPAPAPPGARGRPAGSGWKISRLVSLGGVLSVAVYRGEAPSLRHPASPCGGRELGGGKPGREDLSGSPKIYQQAARREELGTSQARLSLFFPAVMPLD